MGWREAGIKLGTPDTCFCCLVFQKFPLESEDSILTSTLKQFSSYLDDVSTSTDSLHRY